MALLVAALLLVIGLSVLASVLRGLVRGVLLAGALLLVVALTPWGRSHLRQLPDVVSALSRFLPSAHPAPPQAAQFVRARDSASTEHVALGHATVKRDNGHVDERPQSPSPDEGVRWPPSLPEPAPAK